MDSEDSHFGVNRNMQPAQAMPPSNMQFDAKEQALMWQQGHYMGGHESGFHSGTGTQNPSVSGHESEIMNPSSISDVVSTHGSMYSDVEGSIHGFQQMFGAPHNDDNGNNNNHKPGASGSERVEEFIPQLIKILRDDDQFVVTEALANIDKCSRKEYFLKAVMGHGEIVAGIVNALNANSDNGMSSEAVKSASNILRNMSLHKRGRQAIIQVGGIPSLVGLLASVVDRVLFCAITILHNLLIHQEDGSKQAIKEAGGIQKMTHLLKRDNVKLLTIVTDCLRIMSYGNQSSKLIVLESNGPFLLVQIMLNQQYEKLLMMTSRLLKVLSVCSKNKLAIIEAGGMEALAKQVGHPNSRLMHNCIWTLRNLSDAGTMIENIESFIGIAVQLLHHSDLNIVICAAGIISNLTCNNGRNKIAVCVAGGINALVDVIKNYGGNKDCVEPAMCALRHLTNNHPEYETAQNVLCYQLGALPVIMNVLHNANYRPLIKAVLGVVRNLAQRPENQAALRENGFLVELAHLLRVAMQDGGGPVDGVGVQEIIEFTVGALLIFAKDAQNRIILRNIPKFVLTLLELIQNRVSENIQRVSAGVLCEIASDKEGAMCLYQCGAAEPVKVLLNSKNERIASYATSIMYSLSGVPKQPSFPNWGNQGMNSMNTNNVSFGQISGGNPHHQPSRGYSNMAFDGGVPVEPMEGLGLGSHPGSVYGGPDDDCMDMGGAGGGGGGMPNAVPDDLPNDLSFDWTDL